MDFVEGPPAVLKTGLPLDQAEAIQARLEAAGGRASVRPTGSATLDVWLEGLADPAKKIRVIVAVREVAGVGLIEARDLVECCPAVVITGLSRSQAEAVKARLEGAGARISLRG
jgi:large subunit ribosomal protein L7/L12